MANPSKMMAPSRDGDVDLVKVVNPSESINWWHVLAIAGIAFLAMLPAFSYGIFKAHDLTDFHLRWAKQFSDQFWAGDLYPRWLLNMNAGLGSPTFIFYAPVPYYVTSLLRPLVVGVDPYGWHQLSLGAYTGLCLSGMTTYVWLRGLMPSQFSLLGAIVYMIAPYHLAVDLYARFSYGEFWGFVWFPLILHFAQKLVTGQRRAIAGFAIAEALLIMTHLPCFLMFVLLPIGYVACLSPQTQRQRALIGVGLGSLLAMGLATIYWLPAITNQDFVAHVIERSDYFRDNFLFASHPPQELQSFKAFLEIVTMLTLALGSCAGVIAYRHPSAAIRQQVRFWLAIAAISVYMATPLSYPLWQLLPPLQRMELPWRFQTMLSLAISVLIALACLGLPQPLRWRQQLLPQASAIVGIGCLLAGLALWPVLALLPTAGNPALPWNQSSVKMLWVALLSLLIFGIAHIKWFAPRTHHKAVVSSLLLGVLLLVLSGAAIRGYLRPPAQLAANLAISRDALVHRPIAIPAQLYTLTGLRQLRDRFGTAPTLEAQPQIKATLWQPRRLVLQTQTTTDQWLTVRQFYYPGWAATLADSSQPLAVRPSDAEGLLQVKVPAGMHQVTLVLQPVAQEQQAQRISAITAIALLLIVGWQSASARQHPSNTSIKRPHQAPTMTTPP